MRWVLVALLFACASGGNAAPLADAIPCDSTVIPTPVVDVTTVAELNAALATVAAGGTISIAAGTYADVNLLFGTGGQALTGEVLIKGADPTNKPLLRGAIGTNRAVIQAANVTTRLRLQDLKLDGRRSSQTASAVTACTDTSPADGICDSPSQTTTFANGFNTRITTTGKTQSCLLRVDVIETVGTAIQISQPANSAVQDSTVKGAGCTAALCPSLVVPAVTVTTNVLTTAQGIQFVGGTNSVASGNEMSDISKIGIECFTGERVCKILNNFIHDAMNAGIQFNGADGWAIGNTIKHIGYNVAPNLATDNIGNGIGMTLASTDDGFRWKVERNVISDVRNDGVQITFTSGATNTAEASITANVVMDACATSTRTTSAGMNLGDSSTVMRHINSQGNVVYAPLCPFGYRGQRVRWFESLDDSVVGVSLNNAVDLDVIDSLSMVGMSVSDSLDVAATVTGSIRDCRLLIGADLTGTLTNVQTTNC